MEPLPDPREIASSEADESLHTRSELEKRARQVGTIAGQAVAVVRGARNRAANPGAQLGDVRDRVRTKVDDLRQQASSRASELRQNAAERASQWRRAAQERSAAMARRAKVNLGQARDRADEIGHDYPWHLLLGAAIAGFLLGATLRIRKANRAL